METKKRLLLLGHRGNLGSFLAKTAGDRYDLLLIESNEIDLADLSTLAESIGAEKPDIIINAIAYNAVDNCENEEGSNLAQLLNVELVACLADAALATKASLVHYSTDYVFGGYSGDELKPFLDAGGFKEDDELKPNSRYSESKRDGEKAVISAGEKGLSYYLIRSSKLFGPKGSSDFAKASFFDIMLSLSEKQAELKAVDSEKSCFCYTPDLAAATFELIEGASPIGIYHIVNEGACTWYESATELMKLSGKSTKVLPVTPDAFPRPAKRPEYSVLKNTKLKQLRHYTEALQEYLGQLSN